MGVSEPVIVSKEEYEFIMTMKQNRRCNHWFEIGGYTVMFGEKITLIDYVFNIDGRRMGTEKNGTNPRGAV